MSKEQITDFASGILLGVMTGGGLYDLFKEGSDFFKLLAPYLTFVSFLIYLVINWKKIVSFFKRKE